MLLPNVCNVRIPFWVSVFFFIQPLRPASEVNIVPTIVVSATGGIVAEVLPNRQHALWTITINYILWGIGVPLAMATLVIYFERLTLDKLPPRNTIVSCFLPLGPLGQGAFAIMQLGKVSMQLLSKTKILISLAGQILYFVGFLVALIMWGFGLV